MLKIYIPGIYFLGLIVVVWYYGILTCRAWLRYKKIGSSADVLNPILIPSIIHLINKSKSFDKVARFVDDPQLNETMTKRSKILALGLYGFLFWPIVIVISFLLF